MDCDLGFLLRLTTKTAPATARMTRAITMTMAAVAPADREEEGGQGGPARYWPVDSSSRAPTWGRGGKDDIQGLTGGKDDIQGLLIVIWPYTEVRVPGRDRRAL